MPDPSPSPLRTQLLAALDRTIERPLLRGDLDPDEDAGATPAAVLVPVTDRSADAGLILTKRNAAMRNHAGQVSFPGGRIDPGETPVEAALREAEEEIALPRQHVDLVGLLDTYMTGTGFHVAPVLAIVTPDLPLVANQAEVDHWFEVPMQALLDPTRHREEEIVYKGRKRRYWRIDYEGYDIWGATAAMIVNLSRRMHAR